MQCGFGETGAHFHLVAISQKKKGYESFTDSTRHVQISDEGETAALAFRS